MKYSNTKFPFKFLDILNFLNLSLLVYFLIAALPGRANELENIYSKKFNINSKGEPVVKTGIYKGLKSLHIFANSGINIYPGNKTKLKIKGLNNLKIKLIQGKKADLSYWISLQEIPSKSIKLINRKKKALDKHKIKLKEQGFLISLGGKILDTRKTLFSVGPFPDYKSAKAKLEGYAKIYPRAYIHSEIINLPHGNIEVSNNRKISLNGTGIYKFKARNNKTIKLKIKGKTKSYPGNIYIVIGKDGKITVVNEMPIETYLAGILPSELFPSAPMEALKAQAVAARGQVLSKMGSRHMADPFHLCSEIHCQVYRGLDKVYKRTTKAVKKTRGQVLFNKKGLPADTVYHSSSGGHGENNELVWGGQPRSYLRGRTDGNSFTKITGKNIDSFLSNKTFSYCKKGNKYFRWKKTFSRNHISRLLKKYGLKGYLEKINIIKRGVSGRAVAIQFSSRRNSIIIKGELKIRRALDNLYSSLFTVNKTKTGFTFRGGGFGHGVGMSQWGAINRAKKGQSFKKILYHYYYKTKLKKLY
ncbi:MAG: SpoIID/LytB domain-containing protein [Myxococcota bacterium]